MVISTKKVTKKVGEHIRRDLRLEVLDDLFGIPVTPGAVDVLGGRQCAPGDALG
jgi:hypothetical protein